MKKIVESAHGRELTRRDFVGGALTAAGVIAGAPAILRGQNLNNRLRIAFIACGGRALASLNELTITPGKTPPAGRGADPNAPVAPHPDENVTVLCDVNDNAIESASERFPKARRLNDLRRVFDKPDEFDAVVVATAEHTHAFATYLALTHGKHVYCEKPLTYNIWEARLIRETAAKYPKLSTQMGNQGHASGMRRTLKEILNTGRHRAGARSPRLGRSRLGPAGCRIGREVRQAARLLQGHPDRRPLQGRDDAALDDALGSLAGAGAGAAISRDVLPRPALVSLVGFRQRHDERSRQPRQRRALHRARHQAAADECAKRTSPERAGRPQGTRAGDDDGGLRVTARRNRSAAGEAGLASGRQQAARLGTVVGRPRQRVHRRQRHAAAATVKLLPEEKFKDFKTAGADAAAIARPLDRVGQLREGARARCPARTSSIPAGRPKRTISATSLIAPARRSSGITRTCAPPMRRRPRRSSSGRRIAKDWEDILKG